MGLGIGSRVYYVHGDEDEIGTVTDVDAVQGTMFVEWDDEIDNDWYYEDDLRAA